MAEPYVPGADFPCRLCGHAYSDPVDRDECEAEHAAD